VVDVLAHGLWGGALLGSKSARHWRLACLLGAAPDLIALGPFTVWQILISGSGDFPPYVYTAYNVTHSLVVWAVVAATIWLFRSEFPWIWCAWGLHVLCDIPLHETNLLPTPYLWPFKTHFINGVHWGQFWLMVLNWAALTIIYATYVVRKHQYGLWDESTRSVQILGHQPCGETERELTCSDPASQ
jgi:hypothetical protein